jgi:hypothetical protein
VSATFFIGTHARDVGRALIDNLPSKGLATRLSAPLKRKLTDESELKGCADERQ